MLQTKHRDWINNPVDTYYIIGSVVGPHPYPDMVARFQSVVSEEIKTQLLEKKEEKTLSNRLRWQVQPVLITII
jgi:tryptophan synthase beta subunit